jgi:hypothetical protein
LGYKNKKERRFPTSMPYNYKPLEACPKPLTYKELVALSLRKSRKIEV